VAVGGEYGTAIPARTKRENKLVPITPIHSNSIMPTDIRALVTDFTTQLEQMIRRTALEQVQQALGGAPQRRGPGRPANSAGTVRRAAKGGKRDAGSLDEMGATLLAHVKSNPGQGAIEIADAVKTDVGTMRLPMQKLLAQGKVRTQGQRRGTKYFAGGAGGGAPKKATPAARVGKKADNRGPKKAKVAGSRAQVVEVAAAA